MNRKKEIAGHLLAVITMLIWGTTFISTKILLRGNFSNRNTLLAIYDRIDCAVICLSP